MSPAPRLSLFVVLAVGLVGLLFSDAFVSGRVLSQADILFAHAPWSAHAPEGFTRPGNDLLADIPQVFYPFLAQTAKTLKSGALPVWTPAIFGGHPFLASYQTATFSPFTLPALVLEPAEALLAAAMAKLLVGALGMWLFLRRLGLSSPAVWFGATAWLLNPFSVLWVEHPVSNVSAWLPLLLWSADRLLASRAARDIGVLAVLVGAVILAGHPETSYKVLLFAGAYILTGLVFQAEGRQGTAGARARAAARTLLICFVPAGLLGLLLASIQVAPFAEYLRQSYIWEMRSEAAANIYPAPSPTLVTAIVPNFFGNPSKGLYLSMRNAYGVVSNFCEQVLYPGMAAWLLAAVGLVAARAGWRVRFFAMSAVIAALLMYGVPGFVHLLMLVPGASVVVLTRFGLMTIVSVMILASFGVDALTRAAPAVAPRLWPAAAALAAMFVTVVLWFAWGYSLLEQNGLTASTLAWTAGGFFIGALTVTVIALRRRGDLGVRAFAVLVVAFCAVDLFALGWRFHPMIPRSQLFASTPEIDLVRADRGLFRVAGIGDAMLPNAAMVYGLQDLRGYDGMQPSVHGDVLGISHKGGAYRVVRESETFHVLDLMNVKYVFAKADAQLPAPHFTRLVSEGGATVFRNERAFPRAFLVCAVRVSTRDESLRLIRTDQVDLRREAVLYEPLPAGDQPEPCAAGDEGTARVRRYEDTTLEIESEASGRRLLVLGDLDYPGWRAALDDQPASIVRANRGLRAVVVPPGRHRVVFTFEPASVRIGAWLSVSALVAIGLLLVRPTRSAS